MAEKQYCIDIQDLAVKFTTMDGVVHAVNGVELKKGKPWGWWGKPARGRLPQPFLF